MGSRNAFVHAGRHLPEILYIPPTVERITDEDYCKNTIVREIRRDWLVRGLERLREAS